AVNVAGPAAAGSVAVPLAVPFARVVVDGGETPDDHVTVAPLMGLLFVSATRTTSGAASDEPATPVWLFPLTIVSVAAAPAVPVALKVTGVSAPELAVKDAGPAAAGSVAVPLAVPFAAVVV